MSSFRSLEPGKNVLVTGAAGFIGFHLSKRLLDLGLNVTGVDNLNDYYDVKLKLDRLAILKPIDGFRFVEADISDKAAVFDIFAGGKFDAVVNLAAQAGVRYSITNPDAYIQSNVTGFFNVLEACRTYPVEHLVYASSSSVYGNQQKIPFSVSDDVSHPISLYAATKKSNELMAYTYSHLYAIPTTGLRFFTVYGPYGRPDMAYFSFTESIVAGKPIKLFNNGDMMRDFTYIDDIVKGVCNVLANPPSGKDLAKVYNIGNNSPVSLEQFVLTIENCLIEQGLTDAPAKREYLPMQPGDVYLTYADVDDLINDFGFKPSTSIADGIGMFVKWYREYYGHGA
ncbi:MAG: NAD-dependent epimerase/dehydratase family protein [Clostridia bacterium]|nr:NAD-dependent epimerase/dehydratase family protein [Clostridia bacterium]